LSPISQEVSKQRIEHVANSKSCVSVHTGYGAFFASYFNNCKKSVLHLVLRIQDFP